MDFGPYGNTWWCQKWLETLLSGADANTVATGMRYAMREQVKSIDIVDNRVISVVKGPNGGLHNNYIVFPLFARERCEMFMSLLRQQPSEMLALNNKALNESIEILLAKSGLQLFDEPEKVKMGCDCRDPTPACCSSCTGWTSRWRRTLPRLPLTWTPRRNRAWYVRWASRADSSTTMPEKSHPGTAASTTWI